jgi:hypothetical protein
MIFESDTERIFRERVTVKTFDLKYCEKGNDFVRFKIDGKLFEVRIKEKKSKQKIKEI